MNWQDLLTGVAAGFTTAAAFDYVAMKIRSRKVVKKADPLPAQPPGSPWQAMPCGKRMELSDTGFYITLNPDEPSRIYQGFTPEHLRIVTGADLAGMKKYLEGEARERAEFEPKAKGWKP